MASLNDPRETGGRLIGAQQVAGTSVYNMSGEKLGSVEDLMIDKTTGRVAYAVLGFGGFLGIGNRHHPLPWSTLHFDRSIGGFVVNLDRSVLEGAPTYGEGETPAWEDEQWGRRVHDYYHAQPYWDSLI